MTTAYPETNAEVIEKALYCLKHGETESVENWLGLLRERLKGRAPAQAAEPVAIGEYDLSTSAGGRGYIAEFFAKRLRNHHYRRYIEERLAADFACTLARYLSEHDTAQKPPATSPSAEG